MVRVITQETYDEAVKDNIDEFEMSPEEAIEEAIAQFVAQGVDLSNIIKDLALGDGDAHLVSTTVTKLKQLSEKSTQDDDAILKELDVLKKECKKDLARRIRAEKDGAYPILIDLLEKRQKIYLENKSERDSQLAVSILNTLIALMDTQPDLLENRGLDIIMSTLESSKDEQILSATLRWASVCCLKHEMNRQRIFARNPGGVLKSLITMKNSKVLMPALQLTRRFALDDDIRVEFGKAHEHARDLGVQLLEPLAKALREDMAPPEVSDLMLTIASLLVTNELCKKVADAGVDVLFTILADNFENVTVVQQATKLITALAGNDDVKRALVESGIVPITIALLDKYTMDPVTTPLLLKCIAMLCLREPGHSKQFLENGAPEAIVDCIKNHMENASIQKNACWAIRNMVARCRDHNTKFHELGAEQLLACSLERFGEQFGFDIKSAMRDLECDVKLDEQWTGTGAQIAND